MINYFYFELHTINNKFQIRNEKILYERPPTDYDGYLCEYLNSKHVSNLKYYVNVDKMLKHYKNITTKHLK